MPLEPSKKSNHSNSLDETFRTYQLNLELLELIKKTKQLECASTLKIVERSEKRADIEGCPPLKYSHTYPSYSLDSKQLLNKARSEEVRQKIAADGLKNPFKENAHTQPSPVSVAVNGIFSPDSTTKSFSPASEKAQKSGPFSPYGRSACFT